MPHAIQESTISILKKHVKVQSMTEPLTKLTCKRLSHNQCPETETHAIEMLSHLLDSVSLSSDVIMSYIVDDTYVVNLSTTTTERHYIDVALP